MIETYPKGTGAERRNLLTRIHEHLGVLKDNTDGDVELVPHQSLGIDGLGTLYFIL